jgi:transcriptional regulator with XRE-family HTH domain
MSGLELKKRRQNMRLSVEDLAERLGVIPATLMMWEDQETACLQFSRMLESAMNWIGFELTRPSDDAEFRSAKLL